LLVDVDHRDHRLELVLVEKADLRAAANPWAPHAPAGVLRAPALPLRVVEDLREQLQHVQASLRPQSFSQHLRCQRLNLASPDAADRDLAEPWQQTAFEDLVVVGQGGLLAFELLEFAQHQIGCRREGDLVSDLGWAVGEHHPSQLGLGFDLGHAAAGSALAFQPDPAIEPPLPGIPAPVLELTSVCAGLNVQSAGAVAAPPGRYGLCCRRERGLHGPNLRPRSGGAKERGGAQTWRTCAPCEVGAVEPTPVDNGPVADEMVLR
jgi:hypothetical protein